MMKRSAILALGGLLCVGSATADDAETRAAASREAVKAFATQLQGELQGAMKAGGPVAAIEVCNQRAPAIAAAISEQKGWEVGRTTLKLRNPDNAPDAWEQSVLERFDARRAAGEDPAKIEHYEVVEQDGRQVFRYMKAIGTAEACLTCHGTDVPAPVAGQLAKLYPQDKARGYQLGDIRGAFTIVQPK